LTSESVPVLVSDLESLSLRNCLATFRRDAKPVFSPTTKLLDHPRRSREDPRRTPGWREVDLDGRSHCGRYVVGEGSLFPEEVETYTVFADGVVTNQFSGEDQRCHTLDLSRFAGTPSPPLAGLRVSWS
jgi:hypothetical protein